MSEAGDRRVRFGAYEADLAAGELRKNGKKLPLQEQPFQLLAALLERPGEVVTREHLRERLWPGQPFIDFDQGLNTAINKLRDALGDSASNPRFVETVPRRGYRFSFTPQPLSAAGLAEPPVLPMPQPRVVRRPRSLLLGAGILALAGIGTWWWTHPARSEPQLPLRRFLLRMPMEAERAIMLSRSAAISPDGKHIAFTNSEGHDQLWIQHLDQEEATAVDGSGLAGSPFWSPDSKVVGFVAPFGSTAVLKRVPAEGGVPTKICEVPNGLFSGATWSPDGETIVFGSGGPGVLHQVPATGGVPKVIVARDFLNLLPNVSDAQSKALYLHAPQFLPTTPGRHVIVFSFGWAAAELLLRDLDTGRTELLGPGRLPAYSSTGHLIFQSTAGSQGLWAQPFSLDRLKTTGPPFPIAPSGTDPSVAQDGTLVYVDPSFQRLVWVDRTGKPVRDPGPPLSGVFYPVISPDGQRVALEARETENLDIWVYDLRSGARTRLSSDPSTEILPVWSPDGEQVAYGSWRAGSTGIFVRRADASTEEKALLATPVSERVSDWSHDDKHIIYSRADPRNGLDLWYLKRNGSAWEQVMFLQTRFNERTPKFSPDGKYVAYLSDDSGRDELYVRPFPTGDRRLVVSRNGAAQPRWARNGELFYVEGRMLMAVRVNTAAFSAGAPVPLFARTGFGHMLDSNYDVSGDGERFVIPERVGEERNQLSVHVVQNWFAQFRDRR